MREGVREGAREGAREDAGALIERVDSSQFKLTLSN